jgi:lysophospholipase L1-like esterase
VLEPQVHPRARVAPAAPTERPGRCRALLRELRSWPSVALVLFCLLVGVPVTVALTPPQEVVALGQPLAVGARTPSPTISGPAQLVQIGNTELDLPRLQVYGPLRPRLEMGPVQRNATAAQVFDPVTSTQVQAQAVDTLVEGFVRWYLWGGLGLLVFTLAAAASAGCLRMLAILRRRTRSGSHPGLADLWHDVSGAVSRMTVIALAASTLTWTASGALAYTGTVGGLEQVRSLPDLVGSSPVPPAPVGPPVFGFRGAVIGDSRAVRVGGPLVPDPTPADAACGRSTDSLAAETGRLLGVDVLNLACPSVSIAAGLRGPQARGDLLLPPQVGLLRQVQDLDFVVVAIGPNDIGWSDFILYCYAVDSCADNFTQGEFEYRLARFDRDYGDLLRDLADLPGAPQIVVVTSYDALTPDARCPAVRGPGATPGLSPTDVELLTARNDRLNEILVNGARAYGFAVAHPPLALLCDPSARGNPDLQGVDDAFPFHPTATGSLRMAAAVARAIPPATLD